MRSIISRLMMLLALLVLATGVQAQKRKTTKKKKTRTTRVVKQTINTEAVPLDSLIGKVYSGKVGQTVVDFFGTRNVYGDVTQEVYVWHDSTAVIRQMNGNEEVYSVLPYSYSGNTMKVGDFTYNATANGGALQLQSMKQKDEKRDGKLSSTATATMLENIYKRGKYLNGMTEQTDEDKQNARTCLTIAAEQNVDGAKTFLTDYYTKLADKGDKDAITYMFKAESEAKNYSKAHEYVDKLIEAEPSHIDYQCDKGMLYIKEGKTSQAKKIWKKLQKKNASYVKNSNHPFVAKMK